MIPIIDFEKRSFAGQNMSSGDFDDFLMETAMELQDDYDLKWDWNTIMADDERAEVAKSESLIRPEPSPACRG